MTKLLLNHYKKPGAKHQIYQELTWKIIISLPVFSSGWLDWWEMDWETFQSEVWTADCLQYHWLWMQFAYIYIYMYGVFFVKWRFAASSSCVRTRTCTWTGGRWRLTPARHRSTSGRTTALQRREAAIWCRLGHSAFCRRRVADI